MSQRGLHGLLLACAAALGGCSTDLSPVETVLQPTPIDMSDLAPQEIRFDAPASAVVRITVSGRNIDVKAAALGNGATATAHFADAPNRRMGVETLLVEPAHGGTIAVRIERNDHGEARGVARIEAVVLPVATDADRRRLEAARLEATACLQFPDPAQGAASADAFAAAARLHARNDDAFAAGTARLHAAGARYLRQNDWRGAADLAARARDELEAVEAAALAALALRVEGSALDVESQSGDLSPGARRRMIEKARRQLTRAADEFTALDYVYEAAYALNYRGVSYQETNEREAARSDYLSALQRFEAVHDRPAQALSRQSLAYLDYEDGRLTEAARGYEAALQLIPREADPENYAHTLQNSAYPVQMLGRFDEAISRFFEASRILHGLGDRNGEARALHGMATALLHSGERERAKELLEASIRLRQATGSRRDQAISLVVLGRIEREAGDTAKAIELHQQAVQLVDTPSDRARALLALAQDHLAANQRVAARRALNEIIALGLPDSHRHRGLALAELGTLEAIEGRRPESNRAFASALAVHRRNGSELEQARVLERRAKASFDRGDSGAALVDTDAALSLFEAIGLAGTQAEARAAFRSSYRGAIELRIAALLRHAGVARERGDATAEQALLWDALLTSDRSRAQLLANDPALQGAGRGVPADGLTRRREIYELLAGKRQRQERLLDANEPDSAQIASIEKDIALLRTEGALIEGRIARQQVRTPGVAAADPGDRPPAVAPGVRIAEYFIGERQGWLFEIQDGRVRAHTLPDIGQLRALARQLHRSWLSPVAVRADRYATSRALAHLAFGPLAAPTRVKQLQIVADDALHLVPMAWLAGEVFPELATGGAVVIPSLWALQQDDSPQPDAPDRLLALIADPVFTADDPRLAGSRLHGAPVAAATDAFLTRAARDFESMRRLPSAAVEAREIIGLAGAGSDVLALVGLDATRSRLESASLERFRILHFATHAIADSRDSALAMLALSRWDAAGQPLDGALRLHDISQWRLNADLVVLSGCDTAIGRELAGEGPFGLSQAFLQAGARAVVATLWQVPDASTAVLMREFYRQLLSRGRDAPTALALAQDHVRNTGRWSDPFYWAGFQLVSTTPTDRNNKNVAGRME